jgi:hypothetical protein
MSMKRVAFAATLLLLLTPALYADDVVYRFRLSVDGTSFALTDADGTGAWRPAYATTGAGGEVRFSDNAISAGNARCLETSDGETVALRAKDYDTATLRCLETDCTVRANDGDPVAAPKGTTIEVPAHGVLEIRLLAGR